MSGFDLAAILLAVAAIFGYLNHRVLRLPPTSGILAVALVSSLLLVAADAALPSLHIQATVARFVSRIDFNQTLMRGMLSFLLFAGALHLDLEGLLEDRWTIGTLATVGVLISTAVVGALMGWVFWLIHLDVPLLVCFVFGALISPTDPVAVMGLLKELRAPKSLEARIAGESLFNDGVGVVVFSALVSVAGLSADAAGTLTPDAISLLWFFIREVGGGAALGLGLGYFAYRALLTIDDHPLELLVTLALVMFTYALAFRVHVSGPIAVVMTGLLIGNPGRLFALSHRTREHIDGFWTMIDEILNAVLFLLLGLQVFAVSIAPGAIAAGLLSIAVVLIARLVSVAVPVAAMSVRGRFKRGIVPVLTWSGLRGGLSVAMALSLPPFPARGLILACTYSVVVFSILAQGLTVRRLLVYYRIGDDIADD
jgi:Na+:H+ antiporter